MNLHQPSVVCMFRKKWKGNPERNEQAKCCNRSQAGHPHISDRSLGHKVVIKRKSKNGYKPPVSLSSPLKALKNQARPDALNRVPFESSSNLPLNTAMV